MKFLLLLVVSLGAMAQTPRPQNIQLIKERFEQSCVQGEILVIEMYRGDLGARSKLIELVVDTQLEINLLLDVRSKEDARVLRPVVDCTRRIAEKLLHHLKRKSQK